MPRAAGLADEIKKKLGYETDLVKGSRGAFEVTWNGQLLFSKKSAGRFPEIREITAAIENRST